MNLYPWQFEAGDVIDNGFEMRLIKPITTQESHDVWLCHQLALDIEIEMAFDLNKEFSVVEVSEEYSGE